MTARKLSLTIVLCAVALTLASCACNPSDTVGADDPFVLIEKERWGFIENIVSKEVGMANTAALKRAINTLVQEGNTRLRLQNGDYCLWGTRDDNDVYFRVGIPSNIELDLNGSTLRLAPNDRPNSSILIISSAQNVKISNGTLIGDRDTHEYGNLNGSRATFGQSNEWSSHAWGMGIMVASSKDVELYNLTVRDVTGDCIYVGYGSSNVTIRDNDLTRARRGGIVATGCIGLIIKNNIISDIYNDVIHRDEDGQIISIGAEACITFEANVTDGSEKISNARILNNHLDGTSGGRQYSIYFHTATENVVVKKNYIEGGLGVRYGNNILVDSNSMRNGEIYAVPTVQPDIPSLNSKNVIIRGNDFFNVQMRIGGGTPTEQHPGYRQNYAVIGNKFVHDSNYDKTTIIRTTTHVAQAIIDNQFVINGGDIRDGILINVDIPQHVGIDHKLYLANNTMSSGLRNQKQYSLNLEERHYIILQSNELPTDPRFPDWYRESNDRAEAMAFVNSWKWF